MYISFISFLSQFVSKTFLFCYHEILKAKICRYFLILWVFCFFFSFSSILLYIWVLKAACSLFPKTSKRKLRKAIIIASLCSCAYVFFRIHVQNLQVFPMLWSFVGFRAMNFLCKNLAFYVKEHCVMTKGKHRTGKLKMWKFHRVAYPRYGMHFKTWSCTCFWNRYF